METETITISKERMAELGASHEEIVSTILYMKCRETVIKNKEIFAKISLGKSLSAKQAAKYIYKYPFADKEEGRTSLVVENARYQFTSCSCFELYDKWCREFKIKQNPVYDDNFSELTKVGGVDLINLSATCSGTTKNRENGAVVFKDGFVYGWSRRIAVMKKCDYPEEYEGKSVNIYGEASDRNADKAGTIRCWIENDGNTYVGDAKIMFKKLSNKVKIEQLTAGDKTNVQLKIGDQYVEHATLKSALSAFKGYGGNIGVWRNGHMLLLRGGDVDAVIATGLKIEGCGVVEIEKQ